MSHANDLPSTSPYLISYLLKYFVIYYIRYISWAGDYWDTKESYRL